MSLDEPSVDQLLTAIAEDLLVIQRFRAMDAGAWPMTMQPLLFRTAGLAAIVADRVSNPEQRVVMVELSNAIIRIMPPNDQGQPDDDGWLRLAAAHAAAVEVFALAPRRAGR